MEVSSEHSEWRRDLEVSSEHSEVNSEHSELPGVVALVLVLQLPQRVERLVEAGDEELSRRRVVERREVPPAAHTSSVPYEHSHGTVYSCSMFECSRQKSGAKLDFLPTCAVPLRDALDATRRRSAEQQ